MCKTYIKKTFKGKTFKGITKKDFNKSKTYYVLGINFTSARH